MHARNRDVSCPQGNDDDVCTLSAVHHGSDGLCHLYKPAAEGRHRLVRIKEVSTADLHQAGPAATKNRYQPHLACNCTQTAAQLECPTTDLQYLQPTLAEFSFMSSACVDCSCMLPNQLSRSNVYFVGFHPWLQLLSNSSRDSSGRACCCICYHCLNRTSAITAEFWCV